QTRPSWPRLSRAAIAGSREVGRTAWDMGPFCLPEQRHNVRVSTQTIAVERRRRGALVAGLASYAWVAGHFTPFTWPAAVVTFVPGALGLALSLRLPRRTTPRPRLSRFGWSAWAVVIGAMIAMEAAGFFEGSSTEGHPTIS